MLVHIFTYVYTLVCTYPGYNIGVLCPLAPVKSGYPCLLVALFCLLVLGPAMPTVHVAVHPRGLHPTEAGRAWHLLVEEGMSII